MHLCLLATILKATLHSTILDSLCGGGPRISEDQGLEGNKCLPGAPWSPPATHTHSATDIIQLRSGLLFQWTHITRFKRLWETHKIYKSNLKLYKRHCCEFTLTGIGTSCQVSFFKCVSRTSADLWPAFCAWCECLGTTWAGKVQERDAAGGLAWINNTTHRCRFFGTLRFDSASSELPSLAYLGPEGLLSA